MIRTTGKEALEELYKVYLPGSQRCEVTKEGKSGHAWVLLYLTGRNGNYLEGSSINPKHNKPLIYSNH